MPSRDDRSRTTFGKRRLPDAASGLQAAPAPERVARGRSGRAAGPLPWALRMAGMVGILAVIAASQLARLSRPDGELAGPARVTAALSASPGIADPETTGAVVAAQSARSTRLDPCRAAPFDRLRP